jgi:uncharacterized membrane protein YfcA
MFDTFALVVSALIVGITKAGFGAGTGMLAVPLLVIALGPEKMLGVLLPVLIVGDVLSMVHYPGVYVGTTLVYFLFGNLLKLGPFIYQGLITGETLRFLIYMGPLVFVGTLLGKWMNKRLPARTFSLVVYALAFGTGVKLIAGLFGG